MSAYDEERLARLLRVLSPAPEGWVKAAQELPLARLGLDDIVTRAEADLEFPPAPDRRPRGGARAGGLRRRSRARRGPPPAALGVLIEVELARA